MTGVSVGGAPPLEPDTYDAVITKADVHDSKRSSEPGLYLEFAVGEEGRNIRWQTSLQPSTLWRLKRLLVSLGIEVPDGPFEFEETDLIGIECKVVIATEPHYQDAERLQNKIVKILGSDDDGSSESWG